MTSRQNTLLPHSAEYTKRYLDLPDYTFLGKILLHEERNQMEKLEEQEAYRDIYLNGCPTDNGKFLRYRPTHDVHIKGNLVLFGRPVDYQKFLNRVVSIGGQLVIENLFFTTLQTLGLSALKRTQTLLIRNCPHLKNLKGLGNLHFSGYTKGDPPPIILDTLPELSDITHLTRHLPIRARDCPKLDYSSDEAPKALYSAGQKVEYNHYRCGRIPAVEEEEDAFVVMGVVPVLSTEEEAPNPKYAVGQKVEYNHCRCGWIPAVIIEWQDRHFPFTVRYLDPSTSKSYAHGVVPEQIRPSQEAVEEEETSNPKYAVGQKVEYNHYRCGWIPAVIIELPDKRFPFAVEYLEPSTGRTYGQGVVPEQIRPIQVVPVLSPEEEALNPKYVVGQKVEYNHYRLGWIPAVTIEWNQPFSSCFGAKWIGVKYYHPLTGTAHEHGVSLGKLRPIQRAKAEKAPEKEEPAKGVYPFSVRHKDAILHDLDRMVPQSAEILKNQPVSPELFPVDFVVISEWGVLRQNEMFYAPAPSEEYWKTFKSLDILQCNFIYRKAFEVWLHDFQEAPLETQCGAKAWAGYRLREIPPPERYFPKMECPKELL